MSDFSYSTGLPVNLVKGRASGIILLTNALTLLIAIGNLIKLDIFLTLIYGKVYVCHLIIRFAVTILASNNNIEKIGEPK